LTSINNTITNVDAGVYTVRVTSFNGCASTSSPIVVAQKSSNIVNQTICYDELPFNWNGSTYNSSGTYTWTGINTAGCDSVVTLHLTINNPSTTILNQSVCSNQLPYNWNGGNYNSSGTYTWTGINTAGCDSVVTLNLIVNELDTPIVVSETTPIICSTDSLKLFIQNDQHAIKFNGIGDYINIAGASPVSTQEGTWEGWVANN
jgi:hypothetical protein